MKLSEAIMLGSTTGHQLSNVSWETCLIGMGVSALACTEDARSEAVARWPWLLTEDRNNIPQCLHYLRNAPFKLNGLLLVTSICNELLEESITLEQAVDAIRSIEPADEPVSPPQTPAELEVAQ